MKRITIDPITRLEGHGKIEIFLNDQGNVEKAYFQIPEFRGFEQFCIGRPVEEMPRITERLCGVCPEAHHLAAAKAVDAVFKSEPPSAAKKLRELFYCAHQIHSHIAHFYALGGPDFVVGPDAPAAKRNILGVIEKVGLEIGKEVIANRAYAQKIQQMIGGKATHPVCSLPGGMSKAINEEERKEIEAMAVKLLKFAEFTQKVFDDIVLKNKSYVDLVTADTYRQPTHYMGLVDDKNQMNFYEGKIRVVDPDGKEMAKFEAKDYLEYIGEHVEPWSYLKFTFLKKIGWTGFNTGKDSGIVQVAPLARLNVSNGLATPKANAEFDKMFKTLGGKPSHLTLAQHWARVIEILYGAERLLELVRDPEITSPDVFTPPTQTPTEGVGCVEAPRGTLIHHYKTDKNGLITHANLIVATIHNHACMCMSIDKVAKSLIKNGKVTDGMLNMIEMAFRTYDPCFACSTHSLPGQMPLVANIYGPDGSLVERIEK